MKKQMNALLSFLFVALAFSAFSQTRTVSGNVTDESGEPLIGAIIKVAGTNIGGATDYNGDFTISNVPEGNTIEVSYVGLKTTTLKSNSDFSNIVLMPDAFGIDQVVVTGVATGTSQKKLGFSVGQVSEEKLNKVPGVDAANALRGKVTGVRVVQPSGNPANSTEVRLRGSTSINGSQRPLVIVDGVIIEGGDLRDINMDDVATMEVVKGAAAASLYGSLAGNGVIQITTKKGTSSKDGGVKVNVRTEMGVSGLANKYPVSYLHSKQLDASGNFILDDKGSTIDDPDGKQDNNFPKVFDNQSAVFKSQQFNSFNVNLSGGLAENKANYYVSYQKMNQAGIVEGFDPFKKDNVRLNFDVNPSSKVKISTNVSFNTQDGYNATETGQGGSNAFYAVLSAYPQVDLTEKDEKGQYKFLPTGYNLVGSPNFQNPLYFNTKLQRTFNRKRLIGGIKLDYSPFDNLTLTAQRTLDRLDGSFISVTPKDFQSPSPQSVKGSIRQDSFLSEAQISNLQAAYTNTLFNKNVTATIIGKLAQEEYDRSNKGILGENLNANGIYTLTNAKDQRFIYNYLYPERNRSALLDGTFDWKDKVILNANVRREGSSLNSKDARVQTYGRGALSYIVSDDFESDAINFLKLRASYGTAGNRPPASAEAIYEVLQVTPGGINFGQTGAENLRASTISELEVGFDLNLWNRVNIVSSMSNSRTKDDMLLVTIPAGIGYTSQYQTIGGINSNAYELGIDAIVVDKQDFTWDIGLNADKVTQEITDLGTVPSFTRDTDTPVNIFRVEVGKPYGTMYGNKIVRSLSDLVTDSDGNVINQFSGNAVAGGKVSDYEVNKDGFVVKKGTFGTEDEKQLLAVNKDGTLFTGEIGNTNPDFNIGFSNTLGFKNFSLYTLLDYQHGGDIYNYTKQLLYFRDRHAEQDAFGLAGHHKRYADGNSTLYNAGEAVDYFVEDGTFMKLREVSLGYEVKKKSLEKMGVYKRLKGVKFSLTGRNMLTVTDYTGFDPEVAINQNPTNFRLDSYAYPNYRTFTGRLEFTF